MFKSILYVAGILFMLSCQTPTQQEEGKENNLQTSTTDDLSQIGRKNYAVIWKWTTTNAELVSENSPKISQELTELWKKDVIENAYYDVNPTINKLANFPGISFFLKAKTYESAEVMLNQLTIVKKGIATYSLYPVGIQYLGRDSKIVEQHGGITNSFVAVWTTKSGVEIEADLLQAQARAIQTLWNKGHIENVYFDIEGTQKANNEMDFVFFINAKTKEEAQEVCNNLPFAQNSIATYNLHPVGVFWMGHYEN